MKYVRYLAFIAITVILFVLTACASDNNISKESSPTGSLPSATQSPSVIYDLTNAQKWVAAAGLDVEWIYPGPGYDHTSVLFYEKKEGYNVYIISADIGQARKYGLMNARGEIVVPLKYDAIYSYAEDTAVSPDGRKLFSVHASDEEGRSWSKLFLIDEAGNEVLDVSMYEAAYPYMGRLVVVRLNNKEGVIDWDGNEIIPAVYDYVWVLNNGLILVSAYAGNPHFPLYGLFDMSGNAITGLEYEHIWEVGSEEGMMYARKNGMLLHIDKNGKETISDQYETVSIFTENLAAVEKGGKWGFVDCNGEIIIPLIYSDANPFSDGLALVKLAGKKGYVNTHGEIVVPIEYDYANSFSGGIAEVMKYENGKELHFVIDKAGSPVIGPKEYKIFGYGNGYYYAGYNEEAEKSLFGSNFYALLDREGNRLTVFNLGMFEYVREGLLVVNDANSLIQKLGIYNQYGVEIVPPFFDIIDIVDSKKCLVRLNDYFEDCSHVGILTLPEDAQTRRPKEPGPITVYLDGLDLIFNTEPIIVNRSIMVPVRNICESLGADMTWNELEQTIIVTKEDTAIELTIGTTTAFVDQVSVMIGAPVLMQHNEPIVPLHFIGEALGYSVVWDTESRSAMISSG